MAGQGCEPISVNSTLCPHNPNTTDELLNLIYITKFRKVLENRLSERLSNLPTNHVTSAWQSQN